MSESFAQLFEESVKALDMVPGTIVQGTVVRIDRDFVLVDSGLKSEALIPKEQFKDEKGELTVAVGDVVDVALDAVEDSTGETRLSREKAKRLEVWTRLEKANAENASVIGIITGKVKGGFTVDLENVRAFLPGSLVDVRPLKDTDFLEGQTLDFKVIKIDTKRNNVVVSRRAVIEELNSADREALLENLDEGSVVKGIVKNLTDYGAFIDLGGIDGLLHITDMSWRRIRHPSELLNVGDEIDVKVLRFEREKSRVSLGMKQLGSDPWVNVLDRFPLNKRVHGRVTNVADYGCFVELADGIEGLVHVSEMDWTNKNVNPHKIVQLNQEVEVIILEVDEDRRRISLGLKQCIDNPWSRFAQAHQPGDRVNGRIKSITDFGVFIGLEGNIDGLIHLSDLSWNETGEDAVRQFKKGDEIEAMVLSIDVERERISLGIKQLKDDPFSTFTNKFNKGDAVDAVVTEVEEAGAHLRIEGFEDLQGYIKAADIARERINDARQHLKVGDKVAASFVSLDRKSKTVLLSIRSLEEREERQAAKQYRQNEDNKVTTTIGDLIKEKMSRQDD